MMHEIRANSGVESDIRIGISNPSTSIFRASMRELSCKMRLSSFSARRHGTSIKDSRARRLTSAPPDKAFPPSRPLLSTPKLALGADRAFDKLDAVGEGRKVSLYPRYVRCHWLIGAAGNPCGRTLRK